MLWALMWITGVFTLMLIPTFFAFYGGTAYTDLVKTAQPYVGGYLGNLGYSSVQCSSIPVRIGKLSVSCPYGTIGSVLDYGVNNNIEIVTQCQTTSDNESCKPNNKDYLKEVTSGVRGETSSTIDI